uniref:Secreted protein n=1 Tax=Trypanosoma vivax (strain Y486) TaxID=1055687 RepID=G0U251_TRYVY|nr:hypothetical protein TVY486_0901770 [Trypanosoma vivax Y486]
MPVALLSLLYFFFAMDERCSHHTIDRKYLYITPTPPLSWLVLSFSQTLVPSVKMRRYQRATSLLPPPDIQTGSTPVHILLTFAVPFSNVMGFPALTTRFISPFFCICTLGRLCASPN